MEIIHKHTSKSVFEYCFWETAGLIQIVDNTVHDENGDYVAECIANLWAAEKEMAIRARDNVRLYAQELVESAAAFENTMCFIENIDLLPCWLMQQMCYEVTALLKKAVHMGLYNASRNPVEVSAIYAVQSHEEKYFKLTFPRWFVMAVLPEHLDIEKRKTALLRTVGAEHPATSAHQSECELCRQLNPRLSKI